MAGKEPKGKGKQKKEELLSNSGGAKAPETVRDVHKPASPSTSLCLAATTNVSYGSMVARSYILSLSLSLSLSLCGVCVCARARACVYARAGTSAHTHDFIPVPCVHHCMIKTTDLNKTFTLKKKFF